MSSSNQNKNNIFSGLACSVSGFIKKLCGGTVMCCSAALKAAARAGLFLSRRFSCAIVSPIRRISGNIKSADGRIDNRIKSGLSASGAELKLLTSYIAPALCVLLFAVTAVTIGSARFAYKVVYGGRVIGYVTDENVCIAAMDEVSDSIVATFGETDHVLKYDLSLSLTSSDSIITKEELSAAVVDATPELCYGSGVFVNEKLVAVCASQGEAESAVNSRLEQYRNDNPECGDICVAETVEFKNGLFPADQLNDSDDTSSITEYLTIKETMIEVRKEDIKYDVVTVESPKYYQGMKVVQTEGQNGVREVTWTVGYVDGVEVSREEISSKVIKEPVTEVVAVGTKGPVARKVGELTWPLNSDTWYCISAYWGDGRGHKAIDIAAAHGSPILAALDGTVVEVFYNHSTYGHYVLIDHGNGIQTRYAHCSEMFVNVGDRVTAGQHIAAIGRTGRATGPHLHFEYIIDGERVDPAPYLGLY